MAARLPTPRWPNPEAPAPTPPTPEDTGSTADPPKLSTHRVSLAGEDEIVPIIYGEVEIAAKVPIVTVLGKHLVIVAVWGMGPISGVQKLLLNDADATIGTDPEAPQVLVTHYTGTTAQGVDPTLAAAIPGFNNNLVYVAPNGAAVGVAYSVLRIPEGVVSGYPRITAKIRGRLVGTPRAYSDNPAHILADLITDPIIGAGRTVDQASLTALAADCDTLVSGKKRRRLGIVLDSSQEIDRWLEVLRTYASCTMAMEGNTIRLVPLWTSSQTPAAVTKNDVISGTFTLGYRETGRPPTVVEVSYTDPTAAITATNRVKYIPPEVSAGTQYWREISISMPGIPTADQAYREAVERYRSLWLAPLTARWSAFDEGVRFAVGDLVSITHPIGITNRVFRITEINTIGPGRWSISAAEYSAAIRSNDVAPAGQAPIIMLPPPGGGGPGGDPENDPGKVALKPITNLTLSEVYGNSNANPPESAVRARWDKPASTLVARYDLEWLVGSATAWQQATVGVEEWTSPWIQLPTAPDPVTKQVQVRVRPVLKDGTAGVWTLGSINLFGRTSVGDKVTSLSTSGNGNCFDPQALPFAIRVMWAYPLGANDIKSVRIYYNTANVSSTATLYGEYANPTRSCIVTGLATGQQFYFWARMVNQAGIEGPLFLTNGVLGAASCSAATVIDYISGQIDKTDLAQTLRSEIDGKLDSNSPALVDINTKVNGLSAQYTVKIQSGTHVAGFGLAVTPPDETGVRSNFIVMADRFAVGHPTTAPTATYPFIIQNGVVYIAKATIGDAWIETAKIANLAVLNGKIGNNAATEMGVTSTSGNSATGSSTGSSGSDGWSATPRVGTNWFKVGSPISVDLSTSYGFTIVGQCTVEIELTHLLVGTNVGLDIAPTWVERNVTSLRIGMAMGNLIGSSYTLWGNNESDSATMFARTDNGALPTPTVTARYRGTATVIHSSSYAIGSQGLANLSMLIRLPRLQDVMGNIGSSYSCSARATLAYTSASIFVGKK